MNQMRLTYYSTLGPRPLPLSAYKYKARMAENSSPPQLHIGARRAEPTFTTPLFFQEEKAYLNLNITPSPIPLEGKREWQIMVSMVIEHNMLNI